VSDPGGIVYGIPSRIPAPRSILFARFRPTVVSKWAVEAYLEVIYGETGFYAVSLRMGAPPAARGRYRKLGGFDRLADVIAGRQAAPEDQLG
jgi:hypothetical protein